MKKYRFVLLVLPVLTAGCISAEEQAVRDRSACSGYGFEAGSNAFADCMMRMEMRREDAGRAQMQDLRQQQATWELQRIARERAKAKQ